MSLTLHKYLCMFMFCSVSHSVAAENHRRQGLVLMKPLEAHDCTNLAAISQAGPQTCILHAVCQMKVVVRSQVHEGKDERVKVHTDLSPHRFKQR